MRASDPRTGAESNLSDNLSARVALPFGPARETERPVGFRFQLCTQDGEIFDEAEYAYTPQAGDEIYLSGNERMRVSAVIPTELAGESSTGRSTGCSKVEPA